MIEVLRGNQAIVKYVGKKINQIFIEKITFMDDKDFIGKFASKSRLKLSYTFTKEVTPTI